MFRLLVLILKISRARKINSSYGCTFAVHKSRGQKRSIVPDPFIYRSLSYDGWILVWSFWMQYLQEKRELLFFGLPLRVVSEALFSLAEVIILYLLHLRIHHRNMPNRRHFLAEDLTTSWKDLPQDGCVGQKNPAELLQISTISPGDLKVSQVRSILSHISTWWINLYGHGW